MSLGIFLYQAPKVSRQVEGLRSANADNIQWTILQLEVEFLELQLAAQAAGSGHDAALDRLRQRFDIFFSRIVTLDQSAPYARVLREIPASAVFGRIRDHADHLMPFMDAPDAGLMRSLPALEAEIHAMRPLVRQFSNQGNLAVSLWSENARFEMARVLRELVAVAVVFFSSTTVLPFVFWRLYRINRQRAFENLMTSARLDPVVGTSQDAIIVTDEQERITGFNRAAATMFAIPRHLARGRRIGDLVLTSDGSPLALNGATSARVERLQMVGRDAAGRRFPVEV